MCYYEYNNKTTQAPQGVERKRYKVMKKTIKIEYCGISYVATIKKHYKNGRVMNEDYVFSINHYVPHPQYRKICENIIACEVKKHMKLIENILIGYSIERIESI